MDFFSALLPFRYVESWWDWDGSGSSTGAKSKYPGRLFASSPGLFISRVGRVVPRYSTRDSSPAEVATVVYL